MQYYLAQMRAAKIAPDEFTYSSLITAYARSGRAEKAMAVYRVAKEEGIMNIVILTQLLHVRMVCVCVG